MHHPDGPGRTEDVLGRVEDGADLIVPLANGEPVSVLDAIEANAARWRGVRVHQMHVLHDRPYLHGGARDHLLHVSYFLSAVTRAAFQERAVSWSPTTSARCPGCCGRPPAVRWCWPLRRPWTATATSRWALTATTWRHSSDRSRSSSR